ATIRDERGQVRSAAERRELLLAATAAASAVIERDDSLHLAWLVRAKAHARLEQYGDAIFDLDMAEQLLGVTAPEILHLRIDALRRLGDRDSVRRLQHDLTNLLVIAPDTRTRALVADYLLTLAAQATGNEQKAAIARAKEVLATAGDDDPRVAVARARILELEGDIGQALVTMRQLRSRFEGDLFVHLEAARMFDRLGHYDEGAREHERARLLQPSGEGAPNATPVDLDGLGKFLGDVDRLMQVLGPETNEPGGTRK
ncbi:MAG: hypothetical protein KDC98_10440, partial [Planctomycetes bacterium]|nr:hypothetical protein [Planctomycetota bacterium]